MADARTIKLTLTPIEAALIWNLVDAQSDAGACEGGNTPKETKTLGDVSAKLLPHFSKFADSFGELTVARHDR